MPVTTTEYKYVELDERNVPFIAGTTMKVRDREADYNERNPISG